MICNPNNPMDVIGHHHKFIIVQLDIRTQIGGFEPFLARNLPIFIQSHRATGYLPKQVFPFMRDNGDKIRPWLAVIVTLQTNRTAVMAMRVVGHGYSSGSVGRVHGCVPYMIDAAHPTLPVIK
ncbi:MAG: hypothetical protein ACUVSW_08085 [Roseiflexus sp.]